MELKSTTDTAEDFAAVRFNRTFMELKWADEIVSDEYIEVLIVPLWN